MKHFETPAVESADLSEMYRKAEELIEQDEIRLSDFSNLYGPEVVSRDEIAVKMAEESFERDLTPAVRQMKNLSRVLEAIIHEHGEQSNWFGENAITIKTSRLDDYEHGVDEVVEFQEDERSASHLALAIDVTFSSDLTKKFERIRKEIGSGNLARVKYFVSDHLNFRGELRQIPHVVVGANSETVKELGYLWLEGKNSVLAEHHIQFQILEEIFIQCEAFEVFARKVNRHDIAAIYAKTKQIVKEIIKQKNTSLKDNGKRDRVFNAIQKELIKLA